MIEGRCRRRPAYVHSLGTIRELVCSLQKFDDKQRETLFLQAHFLMYNPLHLVLKCIEYAKDETATWFIYQMALSNLFNIVTLPIEHQQDEDMTIELFLLLRRFTFEIPMEELRRCLDSGIFDGKLVSETTKNFILDIAKKVHKGTTPKRKTSSTYWDESRIDLWINEAESHLSQPVTSTT